jgi:hypothetical protein
LEIALSVGSDNPDKRPVNNFAAMLGRWKIDSGKVVYEGPQRPEWPFGICVSDVRFLEGEASVTVFRPNGPIDGRILLGYRSLSSDYFAVGLGGYGAAYSITHASPAFGWRPIATAGAIENLPSGHRFVVSVRVRGQQTTLSVDGVRVLESVLPVPVPYGQLGLFAWDDKGGGVEFSDMLVKEERGTAFVIMQFSGFEDLYSDVIEPLTKEFKLRPYRVDQVYGPGSIIEDVTRGIETAQVVIAEITPANQNVFYEVGYAHALKKPTILLADREEKKQLPFDISGFRCLFYENSIGGKRKVQEGLRKHLEAILDE